VASPSSVIRAIGAENQYANVIAQVGGSFVSVSSILDNPNTDPHSFEASPSVAAEVSGAQLIVQNGVGYDGFMNTIEAATPNAARRVVVAQHVLRLGDDTPNPHLWYTPRTMPAVARAVTADLVALAPTHASAFRSNLQRFLASLQPWTDAITEFKASHRHLTAATTEPVADDLLTAMGIRIDTPWRFQADVMNGVDPAPQDVATEQQLLSGKTVDVFCYNEQVVDQLTTSMRDDARSDGVPVVGVYETMPTPGYDYESWMMAETEAIENAVLHHKSTDRL
jgi:zinc/manganese transport system substrate-binding protein